MASRGMFFGEGPTACPFVALENDRDRRSDEPDHRHRCYAEPDPAPRALAHQREYCLAAAFTACPIFQDWAIRAAATPVPLRPGRMPDIERDPEPAWQAPPPWFAGESASDPETTDGQQAAEPRPAAGGFVGPPPREAADIGRLASLPLEDGQPVRPAGPPVPPVPPRQPQAQATVARDEQADNPEAGPEESATEAPPPPFLAGRAERGAPTYPGRPDFVEPRQADHRADAQDRSLPSERLRREDVVPAWGREPPYPLQTRSKVSYGGSGNWISRITTLLAIGVIVALAIVVIILAPSLLGGGGSPSRTPPVAGGSPTPARPTPSPTPSPTPEPSPVTYTVQPGDTLFSIARRHGLTVEQLMAANPQVTNPDLVQIGQVLIIPDPDFGLSPSAPTP